LNTPLKVSRNWEWGTVTTEVTLLEDWVDDELGIELKLTWEGEYESPEEWSVRWVHFVDYLARELPDYLNRYCPAPYEVLATLRENGLPPEVKQRWDQTVAESEAADIKRALNNGEGRFIFHIFERDLDEPSAKFLGYRYQEQEGEEAVYRDDQGKLYYSYCDQLRHQDGEFTKMNSEALHCGESVEGLLENMRDWLTHMEKDTPPIIQKYKKRQETSAATQSLLARLQSAKAKS
jgi:hypothetical protein